MTTASVIDLAKYYVNSKVAIDILARQLDDALVLLEAERTTNAELQIRLNVAVVETHAAIQAREDMQDVLSKRAVEANRLRELLRECGRCVECGRQYPVHAKDCPTVREKEMAGVSLP
jgi:hypothetical protein